MLKITGMYVHIVVMNELLAKLGWSKQYFAERVGLNLRTIQRWAKKGNGPGYDLCVSYLRFACHVMGI